ncbi:class I SAM-dependent methyltransferase [Acetivibrio clariflavus]|uniref:class I SAM-dependent methyltransferase n=1 Tax=Acetivibrio clariflavus TaxID=288965 RepID=UPI00068671F5|nr:class I SAM-dependent methyltransferase [Acetivibrio clariflavus]
MRTLYRVLSKIYGLMDLIVFPNKKANPRKGLANQIPDEQVRVLDVCCGTGNSTIAIGKKNINNTVIGIDLSRDMLKVARNKAIKNKITNTSFIEMNATKLDFPSCSFDFVTISLAFHEMPQELIDLILVEIGRVLKPKGKLYIIEWDWPKHPIAYVLFSIFPSLFEPKEFKQFLKIDWKQLLGEFGFKYLGMEHYTFTK